MPNVTPAGDVCPQLSRRLSARPRTRCYVSLSLLFTLSVIDAASSRDMSSDVPADSPLSPPAIKRLSPDELDALLPKGFLVPFPPYEDTLLGDTAGWQSRIVKYGLGLDLFSDSYIGVNTLNGPRTPQSYDKQSFSATA